MSLRSIPLRHWRPSTRTAAHPDTCEMRYFKMDGVWVGAGDSCRAAWSVRQREPAAFNHLA